MFKWLSFITAARPNARLLESERRNIHAARLQLEEIRHMAQLIREIDKPNCEKSPHAATPHT